MKKIFINFNRYVFGKSMTRSSKFQFSSPIKTTIINPELQKAQQNEKMKAHEEINKKFKEFKAKHAIDIKKPSTEHINTISEAQKHKEIIEIRVLYEKFQKKTNENYENFDEKEFMIIISKISRLGDNTPILSDHIFENFLQKAIKNINKFKDTYNVCFFINFCSANNLNYENTWEIFKNQVMNIQIQMSIEAKCMILMSYNPLNAETFEEFFEIYEKDFRELIKKDHIRLRNVYEILYLFRKFNKGSNQFFDEIEKYLENNLDEISMDDLIQLIEYFSTTTKEKKETINKFMNLFEKRLFQLMKFFDSHEIIKILFSFLKINMGSEDLLRKLENRALEIIDKFTLHEIEKLTVLISNSPKRYLILDAIEKEVLKQLKTMKPYNYPTIFFIFALNDFGTEIFYSLLTNKITNSIFLYTPEQISKLVWGYAVKNTPNSEIFFKKVQDFIIENIEKFSANEIANIVWSFTEAKQGANILFLKLEEQIAKISQNFTIKEVAKILWGYVNKMALTQTTVKNLYEIIKNNFEQADTWDLATILWAFSRFNTEEYDHIFEILEAKTIDLCEEMNNYEFVTVLRAYSQKKCFTNKILECFLKKLEYRMTSMNEKEIILTIHSLTNVNNPNNELIAILEKLIDKMNEFESMRKKNIK